MKSSIFQNNKSQAVRIPKSLALPAEVKSVEVVAVGNARLITPTGALWDSFFFEVPEAPDDFMEAREQPDEQERDAF